MRSSYLIVACEVGKQGLASCRRLFDKVFARLQLPFPDRKIQIFSDGNSDYTQVIGEFYAEPCVDYGQLVKIKVGGRVIDKIKTIIYGSPSYEDIETTDIENMNGICRERIGRLVRKTKCFSKKKARLVDAFEFYQFYWDFMDPLRGGQTPAMIESLSDHVWSWDDFFHYAV